MNLRKIDSEYIIYTVLIGGAFFLFFHSFSFDQKAHFLREGTVLPGYWPRLILVGIIILSMILLIVKIYKNKEKPQKEKILKTDKELVATGRLFVIVLSCFIYANIINYIGYLIGTFIFAVFLLFTMGVRKLFILLFYPLGITTVVYLIFTKILYMSLPRGVGIFYRLSQLFH